MKKSRRKVLIPQLALGLFILALILIILLQSSFHFAGYTIYQTQLDTTKSNSTYIREGTNSSFSGSAILRVGKSLGGLEFRPLIQFDVSSIPQTDSVNSAILELYVNPSNNQQTINVKAYMLINYWNQSTVTWTNATSQSAWTNLGGDYDVTVLDSVNISTNTGWYNFSITPAVQNWVKGTNANYGIILVSTNAINGNFTDFNSSSSANPSFYPVIIIDHSPNFAPKIVNITTDSSPTSPKNAGLPLAFNINWSDFEGDSAQLFICNSSSIVFPTGCSDTTFCSTAFSQPPSTCSYSTQQSDNRTNYFWAAVCDASNCSTINQSIFYVNHAPNIRIIKPNGGELINQSLGNYNINFNVSDSDSDHLFANLYYGPTQNSTANLITNLNLTNYCTDSDSNTRTTNNCSYSWDTTGIFGNFYLTAIVNDSYSNNTNSSGNYFNITSIDDTIPPSIDAQWISSNLTSSGSILSFYANISDQNFVTAWVFVNGSIQVNLTMSNSTPKTYNASLIAPYPGNYTFKIYARDIVGNINDSMPLINFTVIPPVAIAQNQLAPPISLPYSVIKISGELNATNTLSNVYAYLNVPTGFQFLQDYPQNLPLGNLSANEVKNATWFLSTPIAESNYILNITYYDPYTNSWNSSNINVAVTSSVGGGYFITLSGYPVVASNNPYLAQASFTSGGINVPADSVFINIFDSIGNKVVGPVLMDNPSTGIYNYSYILGSSVNQGQWETIVNATKNGVSYFANHFWNVVGGPFDLKDITINNPVVDSLDISITAVNTGSVNQDLTLAWNLTRIDNNQMLDSGADTFMVNANSQRIWTVNPSTSYVGPVRITFIGTYSGTQKAGAFKEFSTTPGGTPYQGGGGGGGGGGTGYVIINSTKKNFDMQITGFEDQIRLGKNLKKNISIEINNTGLGTLHNIFLNLEKLDSSYYTITPPGIESLKPGEKSLFNIEFLVGDFTGVKDFVYNVTSDELVKTGNAQLNVILPKDFLASELSRLQSTINDLKKLTNDKNMLAQIDICENILPTINQSLISQEYIIAAGKIEDTDKCIDSVKNKITNPGFTNINLGGYWSIILVLILGIIIIAVIIWIVYMINKRLDLLSFLSRTEESKPEKSKKASPEDFEEKIKKIKKELEE